MNERELCIGLVHADSESKVRELLKLTGYWGDPNAWRLLGDKPTNYSIAGAQQSRADAALVEKLINSIDARLMDECAKAGVDPESDWAPPNIRYAVAKLVEQVPHPEQEHTGRVREWTSKKRTEVARDITLAATGSKRRPCFTIADRGEGQTPEMVPRTLVSLIESNKAKIPFVQGKFNMGGTGVLRFCGDDNLQLIVTRRDPAIVADPPFHLDDLRWSFTIVRREEAKQGERSSVYRYLAPVSNPDEPKMGGVLRFDAKSLELMPNKNNPYARELEWGTLVKLYDYNAKGFRSNILLPDGLLARLNILLPDPALPIRLHECRQYKGHSGSFDNTLTGLSVRLSDDKQGNLEEGFPTSCLIHATGEELQCTIYVFRKGKAKTYRKDEGLIFTYNGQTHARVSKAFFASNKVKQSYLGGSLLVMIDCSKLSRRAFEDVFMNSRDRLSDDAALTAEIKDEVAYMLKHHDGLRELASRRREEDLLQKLDDDQTLEDALAKVFKRSPALQSLFLGGQRLSNVFKKKDVAKSDKPFQGKSFPTYFRFRGKQAGFRLEKQCHMNMRCRVQFETDVENEYFSRLSQPGSFELQQVTEDGYFLMPTFTGPNLINGTATLTFPLPYGCSIGDHLTFCATVTDETQVEAFVNEFDVSVKEEAKPEGKQGKKRKPPSKEKGDGQSTPGGISLPEVEWKSQEQWDDLDPAMTEYSALIVRSMNVGQDDVEELQYIFSLNRDNVYLAAELKSSVGDEAITRERFKVGMVLIGLALLHQREKDVASKKEVNGDGDGDGEGEEEDIEQKIADVTKAIAPFLIPMIGALGDVEPENETDELLASAASG